MWKARLSLVRDTTSGTEVPAVSTSVVREMSVFVVRQLPATCFFPVATVKFIEEPRKKRRAGSRLSRIVKLPAASGGQNWPLFGPKLATF